jgi:hypothetical protein
MNKEAYPTRKQLRTFKYWSAFFTKNKEAPTFEQASKDIGVVQSAIFEQVKALEKLGWIVKAGDQYIPVEDIQEKTIALLMS